jgi:hypothetical protein
MMDDWELQHKMEAHSMATEPNGFIELYDLTKNAVVSTMPLVHVRFLPRVGERILISLKGPGDWESFKIVDVEYFLNYDPIEGPETPSEAGKITLYVEPAKR